LFLPIYSPRAQPGEIIFHRQWQLFMLTYMEWHDMGSYGLLAFLSFFFFFFWWYWSLNLGLYTCKAVWAASPVHFSLVILEMGEGVSPTICPGWP
jgi:hypothetical protein